MRLPEVDRFSVSRVKLLDDLVVAMGGRAAEELIFGYDKVTTGASSDISQATSMARNMVVKWGLSDKIGPIDHAEDDSSKIYQSNKPYSEDTGKIIDDEIKRIVSEALTKARKILDDKKADLEKLARNLLEYETLTGDEINDLLAGKEIRKKSTITTVSSGFIPNFNEGN
jgi:cell division protease FtsH